MLYHHVDTVVKFGFRFILSKVFGFIKVKVNASDIFFLDIFAVL